MESWRRSFDAVARRLGLICVPPPKRVAHIRQKRTSNAYYMLSPDLLSAYIAACPDATMSGAAEHFKVTLFVLKKCYRSAQFKEMIEGILDQCIADGKPIWPEGRSGSTTILQKAIRVHESYRTYPFDYSRFNRRIYLLFGMDISRNSEEERSQYWPEAETLHKRYRELARKHHPDMQPADKRAAATQKMQFLRNAYCLLLKRRKFLLPIDFSTAKQSPYRRASICIEAPQRVL